MRSNTARAFGGSSDSQQEGARGGALFVAAPGVAKLAECRLLDNVAEIFVGAVSASGGALYIEGSTGSATSQSAEATLTSCTVRNSTALLAGLWYFDGFVNNAGQFAPFEIQRARSARHIHAAGWTVLEECTLDDGGEGLSLERGDRSWFWIVVESAGLVVRGSRMSALGLYFHDPCPWAGNGKCQGCPAGGDYVDCCALSVASGYTNETCMGARVSQPAKLLNILGSSQVLIRNSSFRNLAIYAPSNVSRVGIVNSTLEPPPGTEVHQKVQDNINGQHRCDGMVAGERLCDPYAECEPGPSGGLRCTCRGSVRDQPGAFPNGQFCTEPLPCDAGEYVNEQDMVCMKCWPGTWSKGGPVSTCTQCQPGTRRSR